MREYHPGHARLQQSRVPSSGKARSWTDVPDDKGYAGLRDAIKGHIEQLVGELLQKERAKRPSR